MPAAICRFSASSVRPLEMPQRFGPDLRDLRVLVAFGLDAVAALGLDAREFEFFGEDLREFLHREIDFEDVRARSIAGLAVPSSSTSPGASACRVRLRPGRRRLCCGGRSGSSAFRSAGSGMLTKSFPFLPISSPLEMYFFRSCLILPRTICRNRR